VPMMRFKVTVIIGDIPLGLFRSLYRKISCLTVMRPTTLHLNIGQKFK
jgi:hypothetical protein